MNHKYKYLFLLIFAFPAFANAAVTEGRYFSFVIPSGQSMSALELTSVLDEVRIAAETKPHGELSTVICNIKYDYLRKEVDGDNNPLPKGSVYVEGEILCSDSVDNTGTVLVLFNREANWISIDLSGAAGVPVIPGKGLPQPSVSGHN